MTALPFFQLRKAPPDRPGGDRTALHYQDRVPVPGGTYRQKQNDSVYVYFYTSYFVKENGRSSNTSVNIGKLDRESGLMIPNDRYFEYRDRFRRKRTPGRDSGSP